VVNEELLALLSLELLTVNLYDCVHLFIYINGFFRKACKHRAATSLSLYGLNRLQRYKLFILLSVLGNGKFKKFNRLDV